MKGFATLFFGCCNIFLNKILYLTNAKLCMFKKNKSKNKGKTSTKVRNQDLKT